MNNVSITVPLDNYLALTRASDLFHGLAQDIKRDQPAPTEETPAAPVTVPNVVLSVVEPSPAPIAPIPPVAVVPTTIAPVVAPVAKKEIPRGDRPDPASLDSEGIPWNARIHGKAKLRLVRDDTWKLIKGIEKKSPGLVGQVKAELLAAQKAIPDSGLLTTQIGGEPEPVTPAPIAPTPAAEAFAQQPVAPVIPIAPIVPITPVTPAPIPQATTIDFAGLTEKITPRVAVDKNYMTTVEAVLAEFGVTGGLSMILGNDVLIQQVDARLDQLCQLQG